MRVTDRARGLAAAIRHKSFLLVATKHQPARASAVRSFHRAIAIFDVCCRHLPPFWQYFSRVAARKIFWRRQPSAATTIPLLLAESWLFLFLVVSLPPL
jgi:hypothetical protein